MLSLFEMPKLPADQMNAAEVPVRYEDIAQDGRVVLMALPHALGDVVWQKLLGEHPATRAAREAGIVPILTRLVVTGGDGVVPATRPMSGRGGFDFAHTRAAGGAVERILLHIWVSVEGIEGRTHQPPPSEAEHRVSVGTIYGEHVLTRLFAPPGQRKVTALSLPGMPAVPPAEQIWSPATDLLAIPDGAVALDDELRADSVPVVFGLSHTDSNQHVNSLVYPRLFEDAALRRLAELGHSPRLLARQVEIGYRKPCFAGDRMRIHLRAFSLDDSLGAVGAFFPDDPTADISRPHACIRLRF